MLPASTHIIGLCLSLSINHGLTGSESPDSAVNHNTNQGGRDLMTDLFGAGVNTPAGAAAPGDERVEAYMLSNVSLGLARLHFETCPKQSRKRFYIECDVT